MSAQETVAVLGLGYVGLPLAVALGKVRRTIGIDIDERKVGSYRSGVDPAGEVEAHEFQEAKSLEFSTDPAALAQADYIILTLPTPVDEARQPDLTPIIRGSEAVARHMKLGAIIIYESTVYPGTTEEVCVPILERVSGMTWKKDFFLGYSPERINPGDKVRTLTKVIKIVSGDSPEVLEKVAALYEEIIEPGVHRAPSIKVAEAAKVIENTQRDLNIALVNELALIFHRLEIDTLSVLEAAGTKWNFLPFRPGLVGGHCIGVDPYYLTHKAEKVGYHPEVILAGRRINDSIASYIAQKTVKRIIQSGGKVLGAKVNVLGLTFKENCSDIRNSRVSNVIAELKDFGCDVHVHDPRASAAEAKHEYGVELESWDALPKDAVAQILAVPHSEFLERPLSELLTHLVPGGVVMDVKSVLKPEAVSALGYGFWRL